jgi:hypothetical protein
MIGALADRAMSIAVKGRAEMDWSGTILLVKELSAKIFYQVIDLNN